MLSMGIFISEDLRKPTLRQSLIENQYIHDVSRDIVIIYSSCPAMLQPPDKRLPRFPWLTLIKKCAISLSAEELQHNSHVQTIPTAAVHVSVSPSYWN